jgi:hypothetical protein
LKKQILRLWSKTAVRSLTFFAAGFITGFAVGFVVRRTFVFKNEVEVGDILNLFSAVVVAFILQNAIQKRVSNVRVEKDLLIARVNVVDQALNEMHRLFMQRTADVNSVLDATMIGVFDDLSVKLHLLETSLQKCQPRMAQIDLEPLKTLRHQYRQCVIGDDFSPRRPYKADTILLEQRTYKDISQGLISLTFDVNNT